MEVNIRALPATRVAGWLISAPSEKMTSEIQKLWARAAKESFPNNVVGQVKEATAATITSGWLSDDPAKFLLGTEVDPNAPLQPDLIDRIFPAARCAIVSLDGKVPNLLEDWDAIREWLETHGEKWISDVSLRRYDLRLRTGTITLPLA